MGIVSNKNINLFDSIADCLYDNTVSGEVLWVENKNHTFASDTEKYFTTNFQDQRFDVMIKIKDDKFDNSHLSLWDKSISGDFALNMGTNSIKKLGSLIFDTYLSDLRDTESDILNSVLSKIGKSWVREKRLSTLLDKSVDSESIDKRSFIQKIKDLVSRK